MVYALWEVYYVASYVITWNYSRFGMSEHIRFTTPPEKEVSQAQWIICYFVQIILIISFLIM